MSTYEPIFHLTVNDLFIDGRPMPQTTKRQIVRLLRASGATQVWDRLSNEHARIDNISATFPTRDAAGAAAFDVETQIGRCRAIVNEW